MKVPYLGLGWQAAGTRMVARHSGGQAFVELLDANNFQLLAQAQVHTFYGGPMSGAEWEFEIPYDDNWYVAGAGDGQLQVDQLTPGMPPVTLGNNGATELGGMVPDRNGASEAPASAMPGQASLSDAEVQSTMRELLARGLIDPDINNDKFDDTEEFVNTLRGIANRPENGGRVPEGTYPFKVRNPKDPFNPGVMLDVTLTWEEINKFADEIPVHGGFSLRSQKLLPPPFSDGSAGTPERFRRSLDEIVRKYQVSDDEAVWSDDALSAPARWVLDNTRMTKSEVELFNALGYGSQMKMGLMRDAATEEANARFLPATPADNGEDSHTDAFRHGFWSAMLTLEFGEEWARAYATAHERLPNDTPVREAMDLYNNEVGRQIAMANQHLRVQGGTLQFAALGNLVEQAVRSGRLVVVRSDGMGLAWSDDVPLGGAGKAAPVGTLPGLSPVTPMPPTSVYAPKPGQ